MPEELQDLLSRSREGAWIEILANVFVLLKAEVAPARERGLKYISATSVNTINKVAPARERGLKCMQLAGISQLHAGRSREGAWIEI